MKHRKFFALSALIALTLVAVSVTATKTPSKRQDSGLTHNLSMTQLKNLGKLDKTYKNASKTALAAKGKHISVEKAEVDLIAGWKETFGETPDRDAITQNLLRKQALLFAATSKGYTVSDAVVAEKIAEEREAAANAENRDEFLAYLSGRGQTEDAYWASKAVEIKDDWVVQAMADAEFNGDQTDADALQAWLDTIAEKVLKEEGLQPS